MAGLIIASVSHARECEAAFATYWCAVFRMSRQFFYYCVNYKLRVRSVGTKEMNLKTSFSLANAFID